jgi:hypothetical protein
VGDLLWARLFVHMALLAVVALLAWSAWKEGT